MTREVTGLDGKLYPAGRSAEMRERIWVTEHGLAHDGKSIRQIVAALADFGVRRSVGAVHADLHDGHCSICSGVPEEVT